jgi:hypothetical protein
LALVHAALTYFLANREEIEASIARDEAEGDEAEAQWRRERHLEV